MKSYLTYIPLAALALLLAGCNLLTMSATPTPLPTPTPPPATFTPRPTPTPIPATPTNDPFSLVKSLPGTVAYDFIAHMCDAQWANSGTKFSFCPGDLTDIQPGYFNRLYGTFVEGSSWTDVPALITLPSTGAIFGIYPEYVVMPGDHFRAILACQGDNKCGVEFALEYYDATGKYHGDGLASVRHQFGGGPIPLDIDLSALAGQTVKLVLALRDIQDDPSSDYALWIGPHIWRDPNAPPAPAISSTPSSASAGGGNGADKTPGVISGKVEMASAPPYLNDPVSGHTSTVVVVFFNLDDSTWWYIDTGLTGHPYYQMTVPPGHYHVVAYAHGVGDVKYVTAGYTGNNPSCGEALKTVVVKPNETVSNITIADWNWSCGGNASRPAKPVEVPIP